MRLKAFIVLVLVSCFIFAGIAEGVEDRLLTGVSADLFSKYVWRGLDKSTGFVLQPSIDLLDKGVGLNIWGNLDLSKGTFNQYNFSLNYNYITEAAYINAGAIYYYYPGGHDTAEAYLTTSVQFLVRLLATFYWDFFVGKGGFLILEANHTFDISSGVALKVAADFNLNFQNQLLGLDSSSKPFTDFYNGKLQASLPIKAGNSFMIEPIAVYNYPLSQSASLNKVTSEFYYGVSLKMSL